MHVAHRATTKVGSCATNLCCSHVQDIHHQFCAWTLCMNTAADSSDRESRAITKHIADGSAACCHVTPNTVHSECSKQRNNKTRQPTPHVLRECLQECSRCSAHTPISRSHQRGAGPAGRHQGPPGVLCHGQQVLCCRPARHQIWQPG